MQEFASTNAKLSILPSPSPTHLATTSLFSMSMRFFSFLLIGSSVLYIRFHIYEWYHMVFFFFLLTSLSMRVSSSIHVAAHGIVLFFFLFFFFLLFLGLNLRHMEVPRLETESELQPLVYATAIATQDPSCVCGLHHSSLQHWIPNPLNEARDWTCILVGFVNHWAVKGFCSFLWLSSIPLCICTTSS